MGPKINPIDVVLDEMRFTDKEKSAFMSIIKVVKSSQSEVTDSPKNKIQLIIEDTVRK